jgi:DNA-binding MarR family transcriptional regulator
MIPFHLDNQVVEIVHQVVVFRQIGHHLRAMSADRYGFELPLLLAAAFRTLIDGLHDQLAGRGHPYARPIHAFALQAIGRDGATVSELGRRLGVSKQAAAKTAASLERLAYVIRQPHPTDARALHLRRSPRGEELLALSAEIFEQLRNDWKHELSDTRVRTLEDDLERVAGAAVAKLGDLPGWLR